MLWKIVSFYTIYEFDLLQKPGDHYEHFQFVFLFVLSRKFTARQSSDRREEACRKLQGFVL